MEPMNPNNLIVLSILINLAILLVGAFVIYMFYARLRDIADELRKFRLAYEMTQDRKSQSAAPAAEDDSRSLPQS